MLALSSPSGVQLSPTNYHHADFQGFCAAIDLSPISLNELNAVLDYLSVVRTFDSDRVEKLSWQGEGNSLARVVWRGLCGWTYPKERGIINITLMYQLPAKPHPSEDLLE